MHIITFLFLLFCTFFDIRTRQLPLSVLLFFGAVTLGATGICGSLAHWSICLQLLPGGVFLLTALLTKEAVGYGDGIVILLLGVLLGFRSCVSVIMIGLLLCSVVSVFLLILKKGNRQTRLPFIPFLLTAWGVLYIGNWK